MTTTRNEERVYLRGSTVTIDLRCYDLGRMACRDPKSSGWPKHGRKAQSVEEGEAWRSAYRAYCMTGLTVKEKMTLADAIREYVREHREGGTRHNTLKADNVSLNLLLKVYDGGEREASVRARPEPAPEGVPEAPPGWPGARDSDRLPDQS